MNANRDRIGQLDNSLVNAMSKESKEIVQTIKSWQKDVNSTVSSAVSKAVSGVGGGGWGGGSYSSGNGYKPTITGLDSSLADTTKKEKQPKVTSAFAVGDVVTVKDGDWSLTSKYDGNFKSAGSTAGWNLKNVRVSAVKYNNSTGQFYYQFDKFGS